MRDSRDNHYRLTIAMWAHNLCLFTGCLMDKTYKPLIKQEKNDKVSFDMTHVVSVLTIAMVFTGLSIQIVRFHSQSRRGGLIVRHKYLCRNFS